MTKAEINPTRIEIVTVEPRLAAVVRKHVAFPDMPKAQHEARNALDQALKAAGLRPLGRPLTIWRPPQDGMIDYAPGVFVPEGFGPAGAVSLFTFPQGRAAHLRMTGPYDGLPDAWHHLFAGCEAQGLKPAGLNWEIYASPDAPPDKIETDLYALLA